LGEFMSKSTSLVISLILVPFTLAWYGYVAHVMWAWFLVPIFGLPAISVTQAIGLRTTVQFLITTALKQPKDMNDEERLGEFIWGVLCDVFVPALVLLVGWVVKHFAF
jgi:hypothetical protein